MRRALSTVFALGLFSFAALAGDAPAVSGLNGKIGAEGGTFDDSGAGIALGSLGAPLGKYLGLQADGAIGTIGGDTMAGGGLHLFTRDPARYLIGAYGSFHTWDSIDIWRLAGEAEVYFGRFTLTGLAGYENVDVPSFSDGLAVLTPDDRHVFGQLDGAYYVTDDFKVSAGYRYLNETSFGSASAEYLLRGREVPMSLFARGNFGRDEYTSITGGLKVYFSADPDKSLIDRNRHDDPENYLPVFPRVATGSGSAAPKLPQCQLVSSKVSSPADGQCICPAGSSLAGQSPVPGLFGGYYCAF